MVKYIVKLMVNFYASFTAYRQTVKLSTLPSAQTTPQKILSAAQLEFLRKRIRRRAHALDALRAA